MKKIIGYELKHEIDFSLWPEKYGIEKNDIFNINTWKSNNGQFKYIDDKILIIHYEEPKCIDWVLENDPTVLESPYKLIWSNN